MRKRSGVFASLLLVGILFAGLSCTCFAQENESEIVDLGEVTVTAEKEKAVELEPNATVINVEKMEEELPGEPQNILDFIRDIAGVYVEDEGSGIEPGILPNIFDDFFKGDRESREGTGLGLSICKRIVEMHHGRIWAESPPPGREKGTRITFTIPKGAICDLTFWDKQKEEES